MGGSGSGAADCTPGSIVWVRRRNGSWWPGRILGPEELADSHLTSPRAGTPVKLLGREDASVDWYNLEKSKRVKVFRCDEFNGCIEKVESSQAMPSKKREKYASREDAILHALELEKQQLRKQAHFDVANNQLSSFTKQPLAFEKKLLVPPGNKHSGGNDELLTVPKELAAFSKDGSVSGSYLHHLKGSEEEREEDGVLEGIPRMRKLQDFGLKIAPSKRKYPYPAAAAAAAAAAAMNGFGKPKLNVDALPIGVPSMRDTYIDGGEEIGGYCRAKRSRCIYLSEDHYRHVDDKERCQSKIQISPSTSGEGNLHLLFRGNASRLSDGLDGGSSDYYLSESGSDSSETEQITNEETSSLSDMSGMAGNKAQLEEAVGSMSSEDPDGPAAAAAAALSMGLSRHDAVSKWQLKGKRNIRNLTRQQQQPLGGKGLIGSNHQVRPPVAYYREMGGFKQRQATKWVSRGRIIVDNEEEEEEEEEVDVNEEDWDAAHFFREYHPPPPPPPPPGVSSSSSGQRWRGHSSLLRHNNNNNNKVPSYWGEGTTTLEENIPAYGADLVGGLLVGGDGRRRRGVLFEVDLKVQVTYPKQRVPIVAVTSKVNGNSIIGHSIQIEAVEDGSSHHLLLSSSNYCEAAAAAAANETSSRIPAWRTARRTANFRVPRPNPTTTAAFEVGEEEEDYDVGGGGGGGGGFVYNNNNNNNNVDYVRNKCLKSSVSQKGFLVRRSILVPPPPPQFQQQQQQQQQQQHSNSNSNSRRKRVSLSSTPCKQKVRTLSSITVQQNKNKWASSIIRSHNNNTTSCTSSRMVEAGWLIEPGTCSRPTTVACIPVKLVFSRLLEKINRPPSRALTNISRLHAAAAAASTDVHDA